MENCMQSCCFKLSDVYFGSEFSSFHGPFCFDLVSFCQLVATGFFRLALTHSRWAYLQLDGLRDYDWPWYSTGHKKRLSYLVGNLVATNFGLNSHRESIAGNWLQPNSD